MVSKRTFSTFLYSYLKHWKQSVNINNIQSMFQILLSSVPQRSILWQLLFNIFINALFYFIKDAQLSNFAYHNTIATFTYNVDELITKLQKDLEVPQTGLAGAKW